MRPQPSRIVFGPASTTPDTTAADAVTPVNADRVARADQLCAALADYIKNWGAFHTPQVEAASRVVPRHLFTSLTAPMTPDRSYE